MNKAIFILIIFILASFSGVVFSQNLPIPECKNIEGLLFTINGHPPFIRIESSDNKDLFGIKSDEEGTPFSGSIPKTLWGKIISKDYLCGSFCIQLTGGQTTVPYDDRVIKYIKVVSYKLNDPPKEATFPTGEPYHSEAEQYINAAKAALIAKGVCSNPADCRSKELLFWNDGEYFGDIKLKDVTFVFLYNTQDPAVVDAVVFELKKTQERITRPGVVLNVYKSKHLEPKVKLHRIVIK